jgi:hypothetical protein
MLVHDWFLVHRYDGFWSLRVGPIPSLTGSPSRGLYIVLI